MVKNHWKNVSLENRWSQSRHFVTQEVPHYYACLLVFGIYERRLARKLTIVSSQHHRLLGNLNNCSLLVSYIHTRHRHFPQLVITNKKIREWVVVLLNLIFFAASFSTVLATFWHEEWLTHAEPTLTAHDDTLVLRISLLSVKSVAGQLLYQNSPIRVKNFMEFWTFSSWLWYACKISQRPFFYHFSPLCAKPRGKI